MTVDRVFVPVESLQSRLVEDLEAGCTEFARALFARHDAPAPIVKWDPLPNDLRHPLMVRFDHLCHEMLRTDRCIQQEDFEFERFSSVHDWMMLLDVDAGGDDFRYLHYGKGIAEHFGRDMTGRCTSDIGGHVSAFFCALYQAAMRRKESVMSEHEPPRSVFVRTWRRLLVPLIGRDGSVSRIAGINLPQNDLRAGLEIIPDPVFVLDENKTIRFANSAARSVFPRVRHGGFGACMTESCKIPFEVTSSPLELVESGRVENRLCRLTVGDTISDDFLITISGTIHVDRAFYVVMVRLASV